MRRLLLPLIITLVALTMPPIVSAQTVAVTGTITDTQTTPYSNGLLTVTFVNSTGQLATFGGNPSFQKSYAIYLDANGAFTISLPPNSTASPSIQPAGTQWNFSYQSQGGYGAANINVTITGAGSISGTLSNLARITWPYGNIPPPGAAGQGIVFVSSTTLGWGTTGTAGAVTHTAGNLTLNSMMLGNGIADAKVDTACVTNGTGALSGCTSISTTGNVTGANLPAALPTTPNGVSFIDTSTPAGGVGVAPAWSWPGVPGRSNAGATDAIVATDRGAGVLETNGGAVAISLPQAGSTNFANNFDFFIKCATTTVCTITPAISQIAGNNGTLGATLVMPASATAYCYNFDNTNYQCGVVSMGTGTVTNIATTAPITGGPITTTGTIACATCNTFSTSNIVPKGNGTTLASSSITDNGSVINATEDITSAGSIAAGSNIGETTVKGYIEGSSGSVVLAGTTARIRLTSDANAVDSCDTSASRVSAGVLGIGGTTCASGDVTGKIESAGFECVQAADIGAQAVNTGTYMCPTAVTRWRAAIPATAPAGIILNSNVAGLVTQSTSGDSNHAVHVTAQTATKTIYTLCPASAGGCNVAGQYRITWYFNQGGTACGTPAPGQVTFEVSWTDNAGAHTTVALPMNDNSSIAVFTSAFKFAASNTTGFASGEFNLWSTGAQPIQVTNTYTACAVGTGTWELTAAVEQVQ